MVISRRRALKKIGLLAGSLWFSACSLTTEQMLPSPPTGSLARLKNITIALLGATGMAGGYILNEALLQGYAVKALARSPAKLDAYKNRIAVVHGDARELASIQELLQGSDIVISALGPVKSDGAAGRDICSVATGHILQAMLQRNIMRYILLSGAALGMPGDDRNFLGWLIQTMARIALPYAVRDKQTEYQLLDRSPVQWTLVRCPVIDAEPFQRPARASLVTPTSLHLRAGELARFVIEQIGAQEYIRKGPFLGSL